jgi:CRP-like cAMP-binding protein
VGASTGTPAVTPEDGASAAVARGYERVHTAGQVVYEPGDPGDVLFVIRSGEIELARPGVGDTRLLARLSRGDFFGEMSVLVGCPRLERAVARSEVRLLEIDAPTFEAMCTDRPEVAIRVIRRIAGRLRDLERRLAALGIDDLVRPVARELLRRAEPSPAGARIATTLRALAEDVGLSGLETHRALQQLLERRLVRLTDDVLVVPDLEALAAALEDDGSR